MAKNKGVKPTEVGTASIEMAKANLKRIQGDIQKNNISPSTLDQLKEAVEVLDALQNSKKIVDTEMKSYSINVTFKADSRTNIKAIEKALQGAIDEHVVSLDGDVKMDVTEGGKGIKPPKSKKEESEGSTDDKPRKTRSGKGPKPATSKDEVEKPPKPGRKKKADADDDESEDEDRPAPKKGRGKTKPAATPAKDEEDDEEESDGLDEDDSEGDFDDDEDDDSSDDGDDEDEDEDEDSDDSDEDDFEDDDDDNDRPVPTTQRPTRGV